MNCSALCIERIVGMHETTYTALKAGLLLNNTGRMTTARECRWIGMEKVGVTIFADLGGKERPKRGARIQELKMASSIHSHSTAARAAPKSIHPAKPVQSATASPIKAFKLRFRSVMHMLQRARLVEVTKAMREGQLSNQGTGDDRSKQQIGNLLLNG